MRLKELTVAGFRGFNGSKSISFHDKLTVLSAPNSHGKTSITEALEFLLYGETSKVASADSKEEYKDSYLNRHYPKTQPAFVEAHFLDARLGDVSMRTEAGVDGVRRFFNGNAVESWPLSTATAARPFVVQHALKTLLLAAPAQRFQGFAKLLGLEEVDAAQEALVNLCTKPEVHIPAAAKQLLQDLAVFETRLKAIPDTQPIAKELARGAAYVDQAFTKLHSRGAKIIGKSVPETDLAAAMITLRNDAAAKVYSGSIAIKSLTPPDEQRLADSRVRIEVQTAEILPSYNRAAVTDSAEHVRRQLQMLGLGLELLGDAGDLCPFCGQPISDSDKAAVNHRHAELTASLGATAGATSARTQLVDTLRTLASAVETHRSLLRNRSAELLAANQPDTAQKIKALLGQGNEHSLFLIQGAIAAITPVATQLDAAAKEAVTAMDVAAAKLRAKTEQLVEGEGIITGIAAYLQAADAYSAKLEELEPTLAEPSRLLRQAIDAVAGTAELSLLIELLNRRSDMAKALRIRDTLAALKSLRKQVDQAVGDTMENAFATDLTGAVMTWYHKIRTDGDPDVHFSGFAMERTKAGDFKNRRVRVAAHSYGVELASAVSSLSESKLNALGLCMSIAAALRSPGPWEFLILDDPIQSWDDDHEVQFIDIIRALVETEGRQIILLSHRDSWIDQVVEGCRSINGRRYEITGYTKAGPELQTRDWAAVDQRLREALAIAQDATASSVKLQQAEEEIRIAACQLTARAAKKKLNRDVGANNINGDKVRSTLIEVGCPSALVDRVVGTFATTDDAHHAPKDYQVNRQRIRQYHGALMDLKKWIDN